MPSSDIGVNEILKLVTPRLKPRPLPSTRKPASSMSRPSSSTVLRSCRLARYCVGGKDDEGFFCILADLKRL